MKKDKNRKQEILEVAERLFLEKGFQGTSTVMIAKEAGCNQAMVHYYFSSKDLLFEAIFEQKMRLFASVLLQIGEENIPFKEKLKRKIEAHFEMLQQNPRLPLLLITELNFNPQRLEGLKKKIHPLPQMAIAQLQTELQTEIDAGNIRPIHVLDLLLTIVSLNMILFVAEPLFKTIAGISNEFFEEMVVRRKQGNVDLILRSLQV